MNTSTLKTLAAGLMTCLCLSGVSDSANAQFFESDTTTQPLNGRLPLAAQPGLFDSRQPRSWSPQRRMGGRYIPTSAVDSNPTSDRGYSGRCENGSYNQRTTRGAIGTNSTSYRGDRRGRQGYDSASRFQSRSALTTGWDLESRSIDPATGQPTERPRRRSHANGEGQRGHCRGGDCGPGQCDCPDGQCDCPVAQRTGRNGQFRHHRMDQQYTPDGYSNRDLTYRNNVKPQYLPTRGPYSN